MSLWTTSTSSSCNPFYYMYCLLIFCSTSTSSIYSVSIIALVEFSNEVWVFYCVNLVVSTVPSSLNWSRDSSCSCEDTSLMLEYTACFFFNFRVSIAKRIFFKGHACGSNGWNDLCLRHARSLIKLSSQTVRYMLPVNLAQCALVPFIFQESRSVI